MKPLTDLLKEHGNEIRRRLHLGYVHWEDLVNKIEIQERAASGIFSNEQVWTFLAGCGYAISGAEGLAKLTNILTGTHLPHPGRCKTLDGGLAVTAQEQRAKHPCRPGNWLNHQT